MKGSLNKIYHLILLEVKIFKEELMHQCFNKFLNHTFNKEKLGIFETNTLTLQLQLKD